MFYVAPLPFVILQNCFVLNFFSVILGPFCFPFEMSVLPAALFIALHWFSFLNFKLYMDLFFANFFAMDWQLGISKRESLSSGVPGKM